MWLGALRCATHGNGGRPLNPNYCDPPRIGGAMMSSGGAPSKKSDGCKSVDTANPIRNCDAPDGSETKCLSKLGVRNDPFIAVTPTWLAFRAAGYVPFHPGIQFEHGLLTMGPS